MSINVIPGDNWFDEFAARETTTKQKDLYSIDLRKAFESQGSSIEEIMKRPPKAKIHNDWRKDFTFLRPNTPFVRELRAKIASILKEKRE